MDEQEQAAFGTWRAAVVRHHATTITVDLYTPKDVYAAYMAARGAEQAAAVALRGAVIRACYGDGTLEAELARLRADAATTVAGESHE
jgi:hypothetical protein